MKLKEISEFAMNLANNRYNKGWNDCLCQLREEAKKWVEALPANQPMTYGEQRLLESWIKHFFKLEDEDDRKDIQQRSN